MTNRLEPGANRNAQFTATRWTLVLAAAQTHSPEAAEALEQLCCSYWYPLYAFARRKGASPPDAENLTQQFFAGRVVTKRMLQGLDPKLGKFRTWLLTGFENFMHNDWARQRAQKRGGEVVHRPLEPRNGEEHYLAEPSSDATPEQVYDRAWAITLLQQALGRLRSDYEKDGKLALYTELSPFLPGTQALPSYSETAEKLGITEPALKMRVSRLRQELGRHLNGELKRLVADAREAQEELRYLITVLEHPLLESHFSCSPQAPA